MTLGGPDSSLFWRISGLSGLAVIEVEDGDRRATQTQEWVSVGRQYRMQ